MDENAITAAGRTALRTGKTPSTAAQSGRPASQYGRPISGILRPGSQSGTTDGRLMSGKRLSTARTSRSARPLTSSSLPYHRRLGTASMIARSATLDSATEALDEPETFVQVSRLDLQKYAQRTTVAKPLLLFLTQVLGDQRSALQLASSACELANRRNGSSSGAPGIGNVGKNITSGPSWWWQLQHAKCLFRLGLLRQAELELRSALRHPNAHVDCVLWLSRLLMRLHQPSNAIEMLQQSLSRWPNETTIRLHIARLAESQMDSEQTVAAYKQLLHIEPINGEAIACIALQHFYNEQPEVALCYYRRVLHTTSGTGGVGCARLYINLALCCFHAQQLQLVFVCVQRALRAADGAEVRADVWYDAGTIALASGDRSLAMQCFRLALVVNPSHAESYNNLAVLELQPLVSANRCSAARQVLSQADLAGPMRAAAISLAAAAATNIAPQPPSSDTNATAESNPRHTFQDSESLRRLRQQLQRAKSLLQTAVKLGPHLHEAHFNLALLAEQLGEYDLCCRHVKFSVDLYPTHQPSLSLLQRVRQMYEIV